jgi:2',3'-cyclic-nucleotide 2'-phosphodiesterase (5'-nucleotidase family)
MFQDGFVAIRILHTNDFHGHLDEKVVPRLTQLRADSDLYFDTGDCVKSGNLAIPLRDEPVWERLATLRCSASVPGNRESHPLEAAFRKKIAGHQHPLLCANLEDRNGHLVLAPTATFVVEGVTVGVIGGMVPIVTKAMSTQALSQFLWTPPIAAIVAQAHRLRPSVQILIALTHIGVGQDRKLAVACPHLDIILGGHSHTVLTEPERVNTTWVCQGGSHGRFAGHYSIDPRTREIKGRLVPLQP